MAFKVNKKAFYVLEFAKTESILWLCNGGFGSCTTQNHLQTKQFVNGTWIPAEWLPVRFAAHRQPLCWYMIRNLRCTVTIDSVLANSKTQNAFLFTLNDIFPHDYPVAVEPGSTPRPLVQKNTWRDCLPIDILLSAVSVLVVAQSSSEIPEGLMNNPVFISVAVCGCNC